MKFHTSLFSIVLAIVLLWAPRSADAESPRIPADVYPSGAHVSFRPHLTNAEMDCMWGFICEGPPLPNFHLTPEGQLNRVGGWGQFAGVQRHGRTVMAFELFVSRYGPNLRDAAMSGSEQAFHDLELAIWSQGYRPNPHATRLISKATNGGAIGAVQFLGTQDLVVMASWSGPEEIEGIALYDNKPSSAGQRAWTSLAQQIHLARTHGS